MFFWHFVRQKEKGSPKADFITVFFEVLLCYFVTFVHTKGVSFTKRPCLYRKLCISVAYCFCTKHAARYYFRASHKCTRQSRTST